MLKDVFVIREGSVTDLDNYRIVRHVRKTRDALLKILNSHPEYSSGKKRNELMRQIVRMNDLIRQAGFDPAQRTDLPIKTEVR